MRHIYFLCSVLSLSFFALNSQAQNNLTIAQELARSGKFTEAIKKYSDLLASDESNIAARLGRGFTYSWNHDFTNAVADFNTIMQKESNNMEAQKGLAYVELWSGNYKKAIESFKSLIAKQPGSKEFYIALGQAQMNDGLLKDARQSFLKAEQLGPTDNEPKELVNAVRTQPTQFDVDILGGLSSADGKTKVGLRFVQVSSQVSNKLQLAAKYDNTLSLDNLSLITNNKTIPFYSASLFYKWNRNTATKIEGGFRNFNDAKANEASSESQFSLEQVVF